jgi:hypothetical protein
LLIAYRCEDPTETARRERDLRKKIGAKFNPDGWKHTPWIMAGGSYSFFRVHYDLKERKFVWYEENSSY